jgi:hypothetical protein
MGEPIHGTPIPATTDRGYEHSDVPIWPLVMFLAGLAVSLIVVSGVVAWLFFVFERRAEELDPKPLPLAEQAPPTPGPLLQVSPRQDVELLREREQQVLSGVGWVDRERGVAQIPIGRAIALTVDRGLPEWPAADGSAAEADNADARQRSQPRARPKAAANERLLKEAANHDAPH